MNRVRTQKQHRKATTDEPEVQAADVKDEELAQATDDLLAEVECCLAEAVVTDEEADLKVQARAEWDANEQLRAEGKYDDYWYNREQWVQKYRELFTMERECCGDYHPVWDA